MFVVVSKYSKILKLFHCLLIIVLFSVSVKFVCLFVCLWSHVINLYEFAGLRDSSASYFVPFILILSDVFFCGSEVVPNRCGEASI